MKILDCTLRDGGFKNDFNWNLNFASRYYKLLSNFNISYIELGYWKQTSKSKNPFYNMGMDELEHITNGSNLENVSILIDYHYCDKNFKIYPKKNESQVSMIRVTSRLEDINKAITFSKKLKDYTGIDLSFQIINSTNYSKKKIDDVVSKIIPAGFSYVYFADSHGNLNLIDDKWKFEDAIKEMKINEIKTGFHFHNHTNRSLMNYHLCKDLGISMIDTSILGQGKGGGNLKLENIINNEFFLELLEFIQKEKIHFKLKNTDFLYYMITGRLNVTDRYATHAIKICLSLEKFYIDCQRLRNKDRDVFNSKLISN
jgi:4-hydroxy 2-oxovalerate aldolase